MQGLVSPTIKYVKWLLARIKHFDMRFELIQQLLEFIAGDDLIKKYQ